MKKQILSTVFSVILSLFLAITLLLGSLCVYANNVVCAPENLVQTATQKGYTQALYEEITYSWENYLAIAGVSEPEPIMAILTPEKVREDVSAYIMGCYTGTAEIDTTALQTQLDTKVREYVSANIGEGEPDAELEKNISELVSACIQAYQQSINIPLFPKLLGTVNKIQAYLLPAGLAAFGFGLLLAVFLFFLQRQRRNALYFTGIATATNALLLLSATWLTEHYSLLARLPIEESALRTLLTSYLQVLLDKLQDVGISFLLATALLLLVYILCCFLAKRKEKS